MLESVFASHWYWLSAAAILLILEIVIPGIFLVWLGLGAALVGLFLLMVPTAGLAWQLLALAISTGIAVGLGLTWQKRQLRKQPAGLNQGLEGFIGDMARVSQPFQHGQGRIHLEDSTYAAISSSHQLAQDLPVKVVAVQHGMLVVEPAQTAESGPSR